MKIIDISYLFRMSLTSYLLRLLPIDLTFTINFKNYWYFVPCCWSNSLFCLRI